MRDTSYKQYSLGKRLILWISIPIVMATIVAMFASFLSARHEIEEVYDAQLVHSAKVLLQLTRHEVLKDGQFHFGVENNELKHHYERNLGFRIWVDDDLVSRSANTNAFEQFEAEPGFSAHLINGHQWRVFTFLDPDAKIKIEVSEQMDIRYELIIELMLSLLLPAVAFIPFIFIIIWVGVQKTLKPVVNLSGYIDQRNSQDLSPIQEHNLPYEIAPFIAAINRLFFRIEDSFRREREFTDHAAHELRTPLAAMKTQTQVLMKKAKDVPDLNEGLKNLQSSIDRATHLVDQLLSLARLQHQEFPKKNIDLCSLLNESMEEIAATAKEKSITLETHICSTCPVNAHAESMRILIRNLLDNAVKYTPNKGRIKISLNQDGVLTISDNGPGLSDAEKAHVFERFVRKDKSGQSGSGLGLSIVQSIADAHDIKIHLRNNLPQGLIVEIKIETLQKQ